MTRRVILRWPDPRLSQPRAPVVSGPRVTQLVRDLFETMYAAPGRGLAAPQVGVMARVFVIDAGWKEGVPTPLACLNPTVTPTGDTIDSPEGCLSIPGVTTVVPRRAEAILRFTTLSGTTEERHLRGAAAICAQHEMDHLDGRVTFDLLDPGTRAQAIAAFEAVQ